MSQRSRREASQERLADGWRRGMYGRVEEQGKGRIFFYIAEEKILKEVIKK